MKNKLKVGLISLLGTEHISYDRENVFNDLEPLGLLYIGGVAQEEGCDVRIFHPYQKINPSEEAIAREVIEFRPDIVGFSSMTNTFNRSVDLAEKVKSELPKAKIVFGGDHIGTNPSDILTKRVIDVGVYGEGEQTFRELLDNYSGLGLAFEQIEGISFVRDEELVVTQPRPRVIDRTTLPLAMRDHEILRASRITPLMYPAMSDQTGVASLLFQFGCPLGCTYCSATTLYGGKLTRTGVDNVVREMGELKKRFEINTAFFTDLTFNLNYRLSEELCEALERAKLGINWTAMVRPTSPLNQPMIKDSTIEAMVAGGCSKIAFGIESFEESAMRDYHRPTSLNEDYKVLRKIDEVGAISKVFLIFGHPNETTIYYDKVISALKYLLPDEVRISFLTPFPGTELWNRLGENREKVLLTTNYDSYTTFNPIIRMAHLSPDELRIQKSRVLKEYYDSSDYKRHISDKIRAQPKFTKSFEEFFGELRRRKVI